ncbi:uncharacterized protein LOC134260519, partial [Saccostrea cucullata]|uniref:uncharacterized protein LOC134260519 n=1 Tax=Saccostrea cuccullata TaxID=36930 RepID=UPI002ED3D6F7
MFSKIQTILFLTCFAFAIFPGGSNALDCSDDELQNCNRASYELHAMGMKSQICSTTSRKMKCIKSVTDYCNSKPIAPALVISKGITSTDLLKEQRKKWGCDNTNGGENLKTCLITKGKEEVMETNGVLILVR